jgi:hypothetical protein
MVKIQGDWWDVVNAFLKRELNDYKWKDEKVNGLNKQERQDYALNAWKEMIFEKLDSVPAADQFVISSHTNLGVTVASLSVPLTPFKAGVEPIQLCLGNTPPRPRKVFV